MDNKEQARLKEAKMFVSNLLNKDVDIAREREAMKNLTSKVSKIAEKARNRSNYHSNMITEIKTHHPNSIDEVKNLDVMIQDAARKMLFEAQHSSMMRDALHTNSVSHPQKPEIIGVQTSSFAVYPMPNADGKTRYDVVNVSENRKIVEGLRLNDAASAIVKLLNKGYSFYSPEVKSVLTIEETYTKHYNDMIVYKRKADTEFKEEIYETRFEDAKSKALLAKEKIFKFNSQLK